MDNGDVCFYILKIFLKKLIFILFFLLQINIFFDIFRYFEAMMSKIIFKNKKILF
jgi:hypothetical protein